MEHLSDIPAKQQMSNNFSSTTQKNSHSNFSQQSFSDFLISNAGIINTYLEHFFAGKTQRSDLASYLYDPLAQYNANAGKRHRPLICMLAASAVGGDFLAPLSVAAAIENFQTAALIHDDIADEGKLRRGKPCLHITQGVGLAINDGDYALVESFDSILSDKSLSSDMKITLLQELSAMMNRTIEGQALDLGWVRDGKYDISIADYLYMASHKTAFYSGGVPLACGALLGGGTQKQIHALRQFGMDTGLAFQIQDDILNLIGEKESHEKDFRSDITEGKRTLVVVHALAHLGQKDHDTLLDILNANTSKTGSLARAVALFEKAGSIDYARSYSFRLIDRAKSNLSSIPLEPEPRSLLLKMADFFIERLY